MPYFDRFVFMTARRGLGFAAQGAWLALSSGAGQLIVAVVYLFAARLDTPVEFGQAVVAVALGVTVAGISDFGSNALWVRTLAADPLSARTVRQRSQTKLAVLAFLSLVWTLIAFILFPTELIWLSGSIATSLACSQASQVPLRSQRRGHIVALITIADRTMVGVSFFFLTALDFPPAHGLCFSLILGTIVSAILGWILTDESQRIQGLRFHRCNPWKDTRHYGVVSVAVAAQNLDLPVMTLVGAPTIAGVYGSVNRWTQPLGLFSAAFSSAAIPFISQARSIPEAIIAVRKGAILLVIGIIGCLIVAVFAPSIVALLLSDEYTDAAEVLRLLAIATVGGILNQPLSTGLQSLRHDREVARVMVTGVVAQLLLVALLVPVSGATGAALALVVSQYSMLFGFLVIVTVRFHGRS